MIKTDPSLMQIFPAEILKNILSFSPINDKANAASQTLNQAMIEVQLSELEKTMKLIEKLIGDLNPQIYPSETNDLRALITVPASQEREIKAKETTAVFDSVFSLRNRIVRILKTVAKDDLQRIERQWKREQSDIICAGNHDRILPRGFDSFFDRVANGRTIHAARRNFDQIGPTIDKLLKNKKFDQALEAASLIFSPTLKNGRLSAISRFLAKEKQFDRAIEVANSTDDSDIPWKTAALESIKIEMENAKEPENARRHENFL